MRKRCIRGILTIVAAVTVLAVPALRPVLAQPAGSCGVPAIGREQVCAVENVVQAQSGIACEYEGKTYWVCCSRCVDAFKHDPDAFRLATDPVSGERVDKAVATLEPYAGRVFFFASPANRDAFVKEPARWMAQAQAHP